MRKAVRLHLLHQICTVYLDGAGADAKLEGNNLVGVADDEPLQHFTFARSQRGNTGQGARVRLAAIRAGISFNGLSDELENFVIGIRLFNEVGGTELHGSDRQPNIAVTGNHDHREPDAISFEPAQQGHAIHPRHLEVDDRAIRPIMRIPRQELFRRGKARNRVPLAFQKRLKGVAHGLVVINNRYSECLGQELSSSVHFCGKRKRNTAPPAGFDSTQRRPPCASTMDWQIERPTPMPSDFVVTKGLNS